MSAVRAAQSISNEPRALDADVQLMQDVLYDILATGLDPDQSDAPSEAIERFLFEHARAAKTAEEFRAFFATHGLSVRARAQEPVALSVALPEITRAVEPMPARMPVELDASPLESVEPFELAEPVTGAHKLVIDVDDEDFMPARRSGRGLTAAAWCAALCVVALCGAAAYYGYDTILALRGEVERTNARHEQDRAAIAALQDQAAGLETSVSATGDLLQRVDQKSDFLVQSLLEEQAKAKRKYGKSH
jgi:hypothetical protein